MIKPLCLLLLTTFLGAEPASSDFKWEVTAPYFNKTRFRFQMPGIPVEKSEKDFQYWKMEVGDTRYYVIAKSRTCTKGNAPIKSCDTRLFTATFIPDFNAEKVILLRYDYRSPHCFHYIFQHSNGFFYHFSFYANDREIFALMTKTADKESLDHQRFIESFAFLD